MVNITDYIVRLLNKKGPLPADVDIDQYRFIDSGHIDSLSLLNFVMDLEEHFQIELTDQDLESPEFRTVSGLAAMIQRKLPG